MTAFLQGDQVRITRGKWEAVTATVIAAFGEFVHVSGIFDGPSAESKSIHQNWLERVGPQGEIATASVGDSSSPVFGQYQVVEITDGDYAELFARVLEDDGGRKVQLSIEDFDRCIEAWIDRSALRPSNARCRCPKE